MDPQALPLTPPPGFQIVQLTAPLLMCNLLAWGLFGALSVQVSFVAKTEKEEVEREGESVLGSNGYIWVQKLSS
ncbi:hypothetical protein FB451DRAFT_1403315 [Mycena latifolia]|nr:hypothetical protein FB451DRAFT_1403315 [Mycena latifolia]